MSRKKKYLVAGAFFFNNCILSIRCSAFNKVDNFKSMLTDETAGDFEDKLNAASGYMNGTYSIIRSVLFILAMCMIYIGILFYASSKGGKTETQGKDIIKRALIGICAIAALGSIAAGIYNISSGITF